MTNNRIAPKIRFPGFTDDWEQRKFGEMVQRVSTSAISSYEMPSVEYEDVIAGEGILNKDVFEKNSRKKGIAFDGTQILYGKLRPYLHNWLNPDFKGVAVGDWWVLQPEALEKGFLYRLIQTNQFNEIANQSAGSKMPRADWNLVSNAEFYVPKTMEEQHKIAEMFDELDNTITLHQRKCEELKGLKKGLLQKMFPENGSDYPEIRFPGFIDAWEQRKCGDVLTERNIQHPQSNEYPLVSFTVENGVTPKTDRYEREQLVKGDKAAKKYKETRLNDIVYNPANLKFGAIARNKYGNAVFSPIYVTYEVDEQIALPAFVEMFVTRESFIQNALQYQQGTVYERMSVNTDDFANLEIMLPSKEEQYQIGELFASLDNTITLHQRKCDSLKELKRGLLQQMFI